MITKLIIEIAYDKTKNDEAAKAVELVNKIASIVLSSNLTATIQREEK